jgi:uncharacterized protein YbjT (DUF2867 family)
MPSHRLVLFGATGMVGGEALSYALDHPDVSGITSVGRRPTGREHDKLTEIVHSDFADLSAIEADLVGHSALLFCLGAYTGAVPDDRFKQITVDYAVEAGRALRVASPHAAYLLLSGQGADRTGKARAAFARYKGMAENQLLELGFPRVHLFRPGYIYPTEAREEPNLMYRVSRALWPVLGPMFPNAGVASRDLARAMVHAALHGTAPHADPTLENADIRTLRARLPHAP